MRKAFILSACLASFSAFGIVDTRSAGYSKTFVDFKSQGPGSALEIKRTYNSRSLYNGLYGFGWCSNLETRLSALPDDSLKAVECGGGMEVVYHPKGKAPNIKLYVESIMAKLKTRKLKMSQKALAKLRADLLQSPNLRAEFLDALDIKGQAKAGIKYYAQGRVKEYIAVTSKGYTRHLPNGIKENFDKQGRLIRSADRNGHIEIAWQPASIRIMNERGRRLTLSLDKKGGKIKEAVFRNKKVASYAHSGEDLIKARNSHGETFRHRYDSLHNLTESVYPDKSSEKLAYNVKKDWVISFKDRRNCKETYTYGVNQKNANHYFSLVKKKCGNRIVNNSKYEFWHKTGLKGGKYLHRARAMINGRLATDAIYHPIFGAPVSFFKNGVRTTRKYYANGFLKEKDNAYQNVKYSNYNQKCRKPEQVAVGYKNVSSPKSKSKKKFVRKEIIRFQFDKKCQLLQAKKSDDEWIRVIHDSKGRIRSMEDQTRKKITLTWHKTLNKPSVVTRDGVGSLRIVYDKNGTVTDIKGFQDGPTVITQVTAVFNSFLTTLSPVSEEMVIL